MLRMYLICSTAFILSSAVPAPRCPSGKTCAVETGPNSGDAMLQTSEAAQSKSMPLRSRVLQMEADVIALKTRLSALQIDVAGAPDVGGAAIGPPAAPEAAAAGVAETVAEEAPTLLDAGSDDVRPRRQRTPVLLDTGSSLPIAILASVDSNASDKSLSSTNTSDPAEKHLDTADTKDATSAAPRTQYVSLLSADAKDSKAEDLKTKLMTLEADVAMLKSKTSTLENVVAGETFNQLQPSFLQRGTGNAHSLKGRINSLEDEIDTLRSRMTNLEFTIEGQ